MHTLLDSVSGSFQLLSTCWIFGLCTQQRDTTTEAWLTAELFTGISRGGTGSLEQTKKSPCGVYMKMMQPTPLLLYPCYRQQMTTKQQMIVLLVGTNVQNSASQVKEIWNLCQEALDLIWRADALWIFFFFSFFTYCVLASIPISYHENIFCTNLLRFGQRWHH